MVRRNECHPSHPGSILISDMFVLVEPLCNEWVGVIIKSILKVTAVGIANISITFRIFPQ